MLGGFLGGGPIGASPESILTLTCSAGVVAKLQFVILTILSVDRHEFIMSASLPNASIVNKKDFIGVDDS